MEIRNLIRSLAMNRAMLKNQSVTRHHEFSRNFSLNVHLNSHEETFLENNKELRIIFSLKLKAQAFDFDSEEELPEGYTSSEEIDLVEGQWEVDCLFRLSEEIGDLDDSSLRDDAEAKHLLKNLCYSTIRPRMIDSMADIGLGGLEFPLTLPFTGSKT